MFRLEVVRWISTLRLQTALKQLSP